MNLDKTVSSILMILLVAAAIATVYIIVNPSSGEKFTEIYMLGVGYKAGNYPTNLSVNEIGNLTLGIVNHEQNTTTYNLVETLSGVTISNQNITLSNNETKHINFSFRPKKVGNTQKLEFKLYKLPNTCTIYRSVFLYVNVR